MNPQVLVAGAGPVGLTMAAELARYGVSVRVVDIAAQRTDKSKALVVWSRTLELLDRAGCAAAFVDAGLKAKGANIVSGSHQIGRVSFEGVDSPFPYALMLPQSETERLLEAHLAALGVRVEREVEAIGLTDNGSAVTTTLSHADGRMETLETPWLIGCDGAHSIVRRKLGFEFEGETLLSDFVLADIHLSGNSASADEISLYWHEDGLLALFPISAGRYRIVADMGASKGDRPANPTLEQVQEIVERRGPGDLAVSDPIWLSGFRINDRKVAHYRAGRVFVAGDAAHIHSPAGGQGMNTGMQDAVNLAWKLALVCRGTCAAGKLLDSYSIERSAVGDKVLADAGHLTAVAVMKNHTAQTVRNVVGGFLLGLAPVRRAMADTLTEVSIGYAHSPLNDWGTHGLSPAPGERVAPVSGEIAIGSGSAPRFTVFARASDTMASFLKDYADLVEPAPRPPLADGGMWLVRPDGYVAAAAEDGDVTEFAEYLDGLDRAVSA